MSTARQIVTISLARHAELLSSERTLGALLSAGVDNWEGWDEAMELLNESEEEAQSDD